VRTVGSIGLGNVAREPFRHIVVITDQAPDRREPTVADATERAGDDAERGALTARTCLD
jgi:hypothetical protein